MRMRSWLPVTALLMGLGISAALASEKLVEALLLDTAKKEVKAFDFSAKNVSGRAFALKEHQGEVIFLNFWATWCIPCIQEFPAMDALNRAMAGKPFKMLAVNQQESLEKVQEFLAKNDFSFEVLMDPSGEVNAMWAANNLPVTYIIDKRGVILHRAIGAREWASPDGLNYFNLLTSQ